MSKSETLMVVVLLLINLGLFSLFIVPLIPNVDWSQVPGLFLESIMKNYR